MQRRSGLKKVRIIYKSFLHFETEKDPIIDIHVSEVEGMIMNGSIHVAAGVCQY